MKATLAIDLSPTSSQQIWQGPRPKGRKNITDRDLNGEEGQVTNVPVEEAGNNDVNEDTSPPRLESDTSVEDEQDREVKRKLEDAHPDEVLIY
jgi:hypothetical protein